MLMIPRMTRSEMYVMPTVSVCPYLIPYRQHARIIDTGSIHNELCMPALLE